MLRRKIGDLTQAEWEITSAAITDMLRQMHEEVVTNANEEPVADTSGGGNRNNTVDTLAGELPRGQGRFDIMWLAYGGDEGLPPYLKRKRR